MPSPSYTKFFPVKIYQEKTKRDNREKNSVYFIKKVNWFEIELFSVFIIQIPKSYILLRS